jgi:hypothetical protein
MAEQTIANLPTGCALWRRCECAVEAFQRLPPRHRCVHVSQSSPASSARAASSACYAGRPCGSRGLGGDNQGERGAYEVQNPRAVQLKQGHSKERRPDLKQLVYSLCVTSDGAVPVHFKAYDGNQTDDGIHLETWNRLRTLLQHPRFIYVADCKLCTERNLRTIDAEHGFFVTVVPKTRSEVDTFTEAVLAGDVRWEEILRKRADRDQKAFDVIECAVGPYHLREGFTLHWYRSSQKKKRDARDRDE